MKSYSWRVKAGTIISQTVNALVFGGHPDMSLSTRAHISQNDSRFWGLIRRAADALFGPGHCAESFGSDLEYASDILRLDR